MTLWQQASDLYEQSLTMDDVERSLFIEKFTAGNEKLKILLDRMILSEADDGFMSSQPIIDVNEKLDLSDTQVFGHFRIIKKIAVGGMGRIYKACSKISDIEVFVALKLIRRELLNKDLARRFDNEKAILGKLKHHNIAVLFDAGVIDQVPYIATEWVDGEPINQYVNHNKLSVEAILQLFLQVCEAVAYAHNNLIIHRDLKPANIMIDHHNQAKLLDFGIAKLIDMQEGQMTQTQVFTPDYAAPEQMNGDLCTTATDIYALGVLLFELFTGQKRFIGDGVSVAEKVQSIIQPKTVYASQVMVQNNREQANKVKGALDTIINQSMHPDPYRRYHSVHELINDIKRYQQHLPIKALGDGLIYRSRMFFKRNTWSSLMALLLLVSLTGGLLYSDSQRKKAEIAKKQAQTESQKSQQMLNFFKTMMKTASPIAGGNTQITVQEMFERNSEKFELNAISDPKLKADIAGQVAEVYGELSAHDLKIKYNQQALAYYETNLAEHAEDYLSRHLSIAIAYRHQNKYEAALKQLKNAYERVESYQIDSSLLAQVFVNFAEFYRSFDDVEQALWYLTKAEELASQNNDHQNMGQIRYYQYLLLQYQLPPEKSEVYLKEALAFFEAAYEGIHPDLIATKNSIAIQNKVAGKYQEAVTLYDVIHQEHIELYGRKNHNQLINHADAYYYLGEFSKTNQLINEAIQIIEEDNLGQGFSMMAAKVIQSRALLELAQYEQASELLSEAMAYFETRFAADHILMLTLKTYWLDLLIKSDRLDELNYSVDSLVANMTALLNDSNDIKRRYVNTLMVKGVYHWSLGQHTQALSDLQQAMRTLEGITFKQEWNYWMIAAGILQLQKELGHTFDSEALKLAISKLMLLLPQNHWYHGFFT